MITPEVIEKIKEQADIVKIIGEYIKLEKKGANYMGLCPFHADNHPSLTVSPSKKIYKCFSCGASGNVMTFVQNYENVSFPKALEIVGEKCGITVEIEEASDNSQNLGKYYTILHNSTAFYEFFLRNTEEGAEALKYLYKRKLNDEIIKRFHIGLAPKDSDLLYKTLSNNKFQPLDMIDCGIVRANGDSYYDVFRNRVMFPIDDVNGNIVGFSGRIYHGNSKEAKYVNSSENVVFRKGNILYNYRDAFNEIRMKNSVYVFEGFMDVIAAVRAGVDNAVATMGTSLTQNQIRAIQKVTNNVIVCYDGDGPGIEATKKAIRLFTASGCNVKAVLMPGDLDPDEYINESGEEALKKYLTEQPLSGMDYYYEAEKRSLVPADIASAENFKNKIFGYLHLFRSHAMAERYLEKLSADIRISYESLKQDFAASHGQEIPDLPPEPPVSLPEESPKSLPHLKRKYEKAERDMLRMMYHDLEKCRESEKELDFRYVIDKKTANIRFTLYNYYKNHEKMDDGEFIKLLRAEDVEVLREILQSGSVGTEEEFRACLNTLKQFGDENELNDIKVQLPNLENDQEREEQLMRFGTLKKKTTKFKV